MDDIMKMFIVWIKERIPSKLFKAIKNDFKNYKPKNQFATSIMKNPFLLKKFNYFLRKGANLAIFNSLLVKKEAHL